MLQLRSLKWLVAEPYLQPRRVSLRILPLGPHEGPGDRQQLVRWGLRGYVCLRPQCTTAPATTASSCARIASASPSTSCATTTGTAPTAPTSPPSVVSPVGVTAGAHLVPAGAPSLTPSPRPSSPRVPDLWPQRVPLCQRALPELPPVGVRR